MSIWDLDEDEIEDIAWTVRLAFERMTAVPSLVGYCGRAALQFALEAELRGLKGIRIVEGMAHGFCKLPDGRIVDVTATQFGDGYGKVVIADLPENPPCWHKEVASWDNVEELLESGHPFFGGPGCKDADRKVVETVLNET